jgi:hypothetical protein
VAFEPIPIQKNDFNTTLMPQEFRRAWFGGHHDCQRRRARLPMYYEYLIVNDLRQQRYADKRRTKMQTMHLGVEQNPNV